MNLYGWFIPHLGIFALALLGEFFLCGGELTAESDNPFEFISTAISFQGCSGLPDWFGWLLFALISLPFIVLLTAFAFYAFNNAITGAIVGALAIFTFLVGFFT